MPHSSQERAPPISRETWEMHKPRILQLYIAEDRTLLETIKIMTVEHNFPAKDAQYNRQFRAWKLKKNLPTETLEEIVPQILRRKGMGKRTRVKVNGLIFDEDNIMKKYSRRRQKTFDRLRKQQATKSGVNDGSSQRLADIKVWTPSESGDSPASQTVEFVDLTQVDPPENYPSDFEVEQTWRSSGGQTSHHAHMEDDECARVEFYNTGNPDWGNTGPEGAEEYEDEMVARLLPMSLTSEDIHEFNSKAKSYALAPPMDLTQSFIERLQPDTSVGKTSWREYARQKESDFQKHMGFRRQEAASWIDLARSIAASEGTREGDEDAIDRAWLRMETELGLEPLPYRVCMQILEHRPIRGLESRKTDQDWFTAVSKVLENGFPIIRSAAEMITQVQEGYVIPMEMPRENIESADLPEEVEFSTFDSVAIHLPRFIAEFGMWHFYTAFALQETARYLSFAQQRSDCCTVRPAFPGMNESNPAQRNSFIAILLSQALISYINIGMADHPFAIDCWEMLMSNTDKFESQGPIGGFLGTVSRIPYTNYKKFLERYGPQHHRTIAAYSQLTSFSLKLLLSPDVCSQWPRSWNWDLETSLKAVFDKSFEFLLRYDSVHSRGNGRMTDNYDPTMPPQGNFKERWQHIVRGNMFDILQTFEDHELFERAITLLNKMNEWEDMRSGWMEQDGLQIKLALGRIYGKMGDYKRSLNILFKLFEETKQPGLTDWALDSIREIAIVATKNKPALYKSLEPVLLQLLTNWRLLKKPRGYLHSTLVYIFSLNQEEVESAKALTELEQVSVALNPSALGGEAFCPAGVQVSMLLQWPEDSTRGYEVPEFYGEEGIWENVTVDPFMGMI
ncbi:hypothetical protein TWF481_006719 [Arthrobotrys musiformis]|uniref:Clr5 domain-containing protein n=1 Tax=Arthrobotrys musiformis TaxID=47236 RepID=A0AAV9W9B6_9PEZI